MSIISEATKSAVTELIAQCFVENRMLDRMVSVLGVKFVYNQTADHIHHGMAHLYPVLADEIGEKCLERYNIPVIYGATPAGNQDYSSVKEIIYAVRDRAINFQNMLIGACKIAQDNNDYHVLADLLDILEDYNEVVEQALLLADKLDIFGDKVTYDDHVADWWILNKD